MLTAVLGAFCIAFSAILVRVSDASPSTAAVFRCFYALPVLGALAYYEHRRFGGRPRSARVYAAIAGVLFGLDLVFWHHAIEAVGAGLGTVLGNLQVVMVGILAWLLLRESMDARLIAAIPVALVGVVLISGALSAGGYGDDPALGVLYGTLTALCYSGFLLILRHGGQDLRQPAGPLFDATLVATVVAALAGWVTGDLDIAPVWPGHAWLITLALTSQVLGWLLISLSLPRLQAALTSVLLTIQPVGSVLLGIILLDEKPAPAQLLGVVLILMGVVLAARRRQKDVEKIVEAAGP